MEKKVQILDWIWGHKKEWIRITYGLEKDSLVILNSGRLWVELNPSVITGEDGTILYDPINMASVWELNVLYARSAVVVEHLHWPRRTFLYLDTLSSPEVLEGQLLQLQGLPIGGSATYARITDKLLSFSEIHTQPFDINIICQIISRRSYLASFRTWRSLHTW